MNSSRYFGRYIWNIPIVAIQKEVPRYKCGSFLINFEYIVLQDTKTGFVAFGE